MMKLKKSIAFLMTLSMMLMASYSAIGQEDEKTDFVYDLIRASYFAETYVDLAMSSVLADDGYEDLNPLYNLYMDKPPLAIAATQMSNMLVFWLTDEIFYYFQMHDKTYIAYIMVAALLLAKTYAIYHNSKAFY